MVLHSYPMDVARLPGASLPAMLVILCLNAKKECLIMELPQA